MKAKQNVKLTDGGIKERTKKPSTNDHARQNQKQNKPPERMSRDARYARRRTHETGAYIRGEETRQCRLPDDARMQAGKGTHGNECKKTMHRNTHEKTAACSP